MNRTIRSLFTAVIVFTVTLLLRTILTDPIRHNTFNKSLVTFASVDSGDASLRHNVEHLVGSDLKTVEINFQRSFRSIGRFRLETGSGFVRGGPMELNLNKIQLVFKQNLRKWWRNRRFDPDVMSNMVNVLGFKTKYKTCAVVGNSGILLKTNLGEVIDNHEFVIRLNNARNGGYEKFVGSKTSLSFMNSNILHLCSRRGGCFCHPYGEHVPIVMYMSQPIHFVDYIVCNSSHKASLMVTDPKLDVLCARIVKYYSLKRFVVESGKGLESWSLVHGGTEFHYSSGMEAVMLALGICDNVGIFGFGKANGAKHHYHTNQKSELSLHDYEAEYDFYEDLVQNPTAVPFVSDKFIFPHVVIHR